jgi:hypothetical protein
MKSFIRTIAISAILSSFVSHASFVTTDWNSDNDRKATLDVDTGLEWLDVSETFGKSYNTVVSELNTTYSGFRLPTVSEFTTMYNRYVGIELNNTINTVAGANEKIKSGLTSSYQSNGGVAVLGNFNRIKYNFGGSLCTLVTSTCSTYSSSSTKTSYGLVLGLISDGTSSLAGYGSYLTRSPAGNTSLYQAYRQYANANPASSSWGTGRQVGTWLVSDGGATISSINAPEINANNPESPYSQSITNNVSVAGTGFLALLLCAGLTGFRKRKSH